MSEQKWTLFSDMASGGFEKTAFSEIWIEAEKSEAISVFKEVFDIDPRDITCTCCGSDYIIDERQEPKIEHGDLVISRSDIDRLKAGKSLEVKK